MSNTPARSYFTVTETPGSNPTRTRITLKLRVHEQHQQALQPLTNQERDAGPIIMSPLGKTGKQYQRTLNMDVNPVSEALINALKKFNGSLPDPSVAQHINPIIRTAEVFAWEGHTI